MTHPLIGAEIGKYKIMELLGRGATADVYKAYQPALDRYVAIKILHTFLASDESFQKRFRREAHAIATLRHPRIVQVYDFDVVNDQYYMVMEFIDGVTLEKRLHKLAAKKETMPLNEAIRITRGAASALSYAHSREIVHRDVKPANVMIDQEDQVILTDFGIAKILSGTSYTATGAVVGTPFYLSPEQSRGDPVDARSDIYSLGIVFFQMTTGQLPYDADTALTVLLKHINDPVPVPSQINPSLPPNVDRFISKAMAKKPADRYQSVHELIEHLDRLQAGDHPLDISLPTPSPAPSSSVSTVAVSTSMKLPTPYTLSHGHIAAGPTDLPAICDANWERAVNHFTRGYITKWLRDSADALRAAHQHDLADELEPIAARAEAIAQKSREGNTVIRNAGLEELLDFLGASPPVADIVPDKLILPPVGVGETGQPVTLTITNKGRGYLFGDIACGVPWLTVTPKQFGCAVGEHCKIVVRSDLSMLPPGEIESAYALLVRSITSRQFVAVHANVLSSVLKVNAATLTLGAVGQGEHTYTTFTIHNSGQGYLVGKLLCQVPWLEALPGRFQVLAGESIEITVDAYTHMLSPGNVTHERAIVIESNGGQATLDAQIQVLSPHLDVAPDRIDLGTVELAEGEVEKSADLTIRNTGRGILAGKVTVEADWLTVEPTEFYCQRGETQRLHLSTTKLRTGNHHPIVSIVSQVGVVEVPVLLLVRFSLEPEMIHIPAGEFLRGSSERDGKAPPSEKPQLRVYLSEYWIGKYPVTNSQYATFVQATDRRPPEHWEGTRPPRGKEDHPIVNVSWWDAVAYCHWLAEVTGKSYRLPTEAQWEKAARGTDERRYPWGNGWSRRKCNAQARNRKDTTPVGAHSPAGNSPYDCAAMAGNVMEWALDWYLEDYYARSTVTENPSGPASGAVKVLRGGSWSSDARGCCVTSRLYANRRLISPEVGFRCCHGV